jgi:DNA modification methylase
MEGQSKETDYKNKINTMSKTKLMLGNNLDSLKKLPDNSIDSVVTDPPYGLSFMNKKWDYDVPSVDFWKEVYRVLKPGGHILSFGGTRTYHRMVVNIEDAGFEIRDQIMWLYGSGFPKSHNIGKSVDKLQGNEREVVGSKGSYRDIRNGSLDAQITEDRDRIEVLETKGQSPYEGWGTALKPANEPICVARKPLSEKSVAENVLKWGTGGINVDGCRVGSDGGTRKSDIEKVGNISTNFTIGTQNIKNKIENIQEGRFPANLILECICDEVIKGEKGEVKKSGGSRDNCDLSHEWGYDEIVRTNFTDKGDIHTNPNCPCYLLDEQSGYLKSGDVKPHHKKNKTANGYQGSCYGKFQNEDTTLKGYGDGGGASRFFYQAKVSKSERNMGLENIKINTGTIKLLIYKEKDIIKWEKQDQKVKHQVATEQLIQKDIEEYTTTEGCVWNTELFGNYITDQLQKDFKSITKMETNLTMIYQILNSWIQKITKEFIATQQKELMDGIRFVENVELKNTKAIITFQNKDGLNPSVSNASSIEVYHIEQSTVDKNGHPTLKPVNLMTYLCRLITPQGGIVLDPFMGSGSTGIAAQLEGFKFVGMEMDEDYFKIATARIENYEKYRKFLK